MDVAVFVAKVVSIIYFSAAFGGFLNKEFYKEVGEHLYENTALTFIIGFIAIILGALILQFHPHWNQDWTALITLFGWISLVKGVILIVFPKAIHNLSKPFFTPTALKVFPFISLLMGILFGYFGFFLGANSPS